jgi:hypothetical protein
MTRETMGSSTCQGRRRQIALLAGGELGSRRVQRLHRHLEACRACRQLHDELRSLPRLAQAALDTREAEEESFRSVRGVVRARLSQRQEAPVAAGAPLWTVLAPVAAILAMAGFLLLSAPVRETRLPGSTGREPYPVLSVSSIEDGADVIFAIDNGDYELFRVAVSSRSSDFREAQVFEVRGRTWVDRTPSPDRGQVLFYRVD